MKLLCSKLTAARQSDTVWMPRFWDGRLECDMVEALYLTNFQVGISLAQTAFFAFGVIYQHLEPTL